MAWEVIEPKKIKKQVEKLPPVIFGTPTNCCWQT